MIVLALLAAQLVPLVEAPGSPEGTWKFWVSPGEELRGMHFRMEVDRSVCKGDVEVNGTTSTSDDVTLRFDSSNTIEVHGCLERGLAPLRLVALPKVHIAKATARWTQPRVLAVEATVRNTLPDAVRCGVRTLGEKQEISVAPETSKTLSLLVRLNSGRGNSLDLQLYPIAEAKAEACRQTVTIPVPRRSP